MKKIFGSSRGQIAALYAGILFVLVGAIALGADVGVMYMNWQQLQKAADAAVLAGGAGLPDNTLGASKAVSTYLANNGIAAPDVITGPNYSNGNTQISLTLKRTVPHYFGRVLGLINADVQVTATAQAQTASSPGGGVFPAGLNTAWFGKLVFDGTKSYNIYQNGNDQPGAKGPLDIDGTGDPFSYMGLKPFTGTVTVNETLSAGTGCTVGQASGPLSERIAAGVAMDPSGTWDNHTIGNPQEVVLPVGTYVGNGSSTKFTISQFVKAWITPDSKPCAVIAYLIPGVAGGKSSLGTPCTAGNGICVVALIK
jgi:hypothetical protein